MADTHSRPTVAGEMSRAVAVSSIVRPPKNRNSTMRASRVSKCASASSAASRAVTSTPWYPPILIPPSAIGCGEAAALLRESGARLRPALAALDPQLAVHCVRLPWATVSVYQMCEWAAGHTLRHIAQVNREMHIAATRGAAIVR